MKHQQPIAGHLVMHVHSGGSRLPRCSRCELSHRQYVVCAVTHANAHLIICHHQQRVFFGSRCVVSMSGSSSRRRSRCYMFPMPLFGRRNRRGLRLRCGGRRRMSIVLLTRRCSGRGLWLRSRGSCRWFRRCWFVSFMLAEDARYIEQRQCQTKSECYFLHFVNCGSAQ